MKNKNALLIVLSAIFYSVGMHPSFAERGDYVQINCVPSMQYFSLNGITLDGLNIEPSEDARQRLETKGMYTPEDLLKRPYTCNWNAISHLGGAHSLTAKVVDYRDGSITGCVNSTFNISIELDGAEVRRFSPLAGLCGGEANLFLEANTFFMRICTLSLDKSGESSCELSTLKKLRSSSTNSP